MTLAPSPREGANLLLTSQVCRNISSIQTSPSFKLDLKAAPGARDAPPGATDGGSGVGRLEQGLTGNICAAALDGLLGLGSVLMSVSDRADPFQALSAAAMALVWNQLAAVTRPRFSTLDVAATCICAAAAMSPRRNPK